ncbi:hypothetical protein Dimus_033635, partial [Dionaea muscipula]
CSFFLSFIVHILYSVFLVNQGFTARQRGGFDLKLQKSKECSDRHPYAMKSRNQKKKKSRNQATGEPNKSSNGELDNNGVYRFQIGRFERKLEPLPSI